MIRGGQKEAATVRIPIVLDSGVHQLLGFPQVERIAVPLVNRHQSLRQERIVRAVRAETCETLAVGRQQTARLTHGCKEEGSGSFRSSSVSWLPENCGGPSQRRDHQAVPARQYLAIQARPRSPLPDFEQPRAGARQALLHRFSGGPVQSRQDFRGPHHLQDVLGAARHMGVPRVQPVAMLGNVVMGAEDACVGRAKRLLNFPAGPDIELALLPLAVGVLAGIVGTVWTSQIAHHVVADTASPIREESLPSGILGSLPSLDQCGGHEGLVVKHLLEMRNEPVRIGGIPMHTPS